MRAIDAHEFCASREQRGVAKVHLVVQTPPDHQYQVCFAEGALRRMILVDVGKAHVSVTLLAEQFLVIGNIVNWDPKLTPCLLELFLGT